MTTPDFILELREMVGDHPLWMPGVTAVVVRDDRPGPDGTPRTEVLQIRRSDNGRWANVAGIVEPAEHPADVAVREVAEEAGLVVAAERLVGVDVTPEVLYENGDRAQYLVLVFRCRWISGEPHPVDGEATEARWVPLDELRDLDPALSPQSFERIGWALADDPRAVFKTA
jgi:ADP-ribose pyrophosphatase YjhB (NUDIX family)